METGKKISEFDGAKIIAVTKLHSENSHYFVVFIETWSRGYAYVFKAEKDADRAYELACKIMDNKVR